MLLSDFQSTRIWSRLGDLITALKLGLALCLCMRTSWCPLSGQIAMGPPCQNVFTTRVRNEMPFVFSFLCYRFVAFLWGYLAMSAEKSKNRTLRRHS
eukprot:g33852.t1